MHPGCTIKTTSDMKKNNTMRFWLYNRLTYLLIAWAHLVMLMVSVNDVYFNAFVLSVGGLLTLGAWSHIVTDKNASSSERLMWSKMSRMLDDKK